MKVYVFKDKMLAGALGTVENGKLTVSIDGVNEGEDISLFSSDGSYQVQTLKGDNVSFDATEFIDGEILLLKIREVIPFSFVCRGGAIFHVYDDVRAELDRAYSIMADMAKEIVTLSGKISKFTDGFITE